MNEDDHNLDGVVYTLKVAGIILLVAMAVLAVIKIVDGTDNRLGTIQLTPTQVVSK